MPGWHAAVKDLVAANKLVLLAITQEQHADRCELFAQWKGFDFPILYDPINSMNSTAVPLVTAVDEHGVVRHTRPTHQWVREEFVDHDLPSTAARVAEARVPDLVTLKTDAERSPSGAAFRALGDAATLWSNDVDLAVRAYEAALLREPSAMQHFRLGVAYRRRHDSSLRQPEDFAHAVEHWTEALRLEPNQYIWRRRIQQYGPRLDKPYPFYDWIERAVAEILQRGQMPVKVMVPLSGAEIASPAADFESLVAPQRPDPEGKITRDPGRYVEIQATAVPGIIEAGASLRLHLEFLLTQHALWNNESERLQVWVEPVDGWKVDRTLVIHEGTPGSAESSEPRRLEVEFQSSTSSKGRELRGYALYAVCDKATGVCLFRRQDFAVPVTIRSKNRVGQPSTDP